jgi:hypothetical protein
MGLRGNISKTKEGTQLGKDKSLHAGAVALVIGHYDKAAEPLIESLPGAIFEGAMVCWNFTPGASSSSPKWLAPEDLEYLGKECIRDSTAMIKRALLLTAPGRNFDEGWTVYPSKFNRASILMWAGSFTFMILELSLGGYAHGGVGPI